MPKVIEDETIYQAVMQVVLERGYAGATTKQMADMAAVSEVTLFRKYESKPQLVKLAVRWLADQLDFAAAAQYSGDVRADLLRIVEAYQDSAVKHGQFFVVLLSEMPRNPELADLAQEPFRILTALGELLARYQAEGLLRREPPLQALAALFGPMVYTAMMRRALPGGPLPALDLSDHVTSFLEGRRAA